MSNTRVSELSAITDFTSGDLIYVARPNTFSEYKMETDDLSSLFGPAGSDTYIQFNDGGVFGGDANFTFDKATNRFTHAGNSGIGRFDGSVAIANSGNTDFVTLYGTTFYAPISINYDLFGLYDQGQYTFITYNPPTRFNSWENNVVGYNLQVVIASDATEPISSTYGFSANIYDDYSTESDISTLGGLYFGGYHYGNGDVGTLVGVQAYSGNFGAGTATNVLGSELQLYIGGPTTNLYGAKINSPYRYGYTATNAYGVYIGDFSAAGSTAYNIYSAGASSLNVFEGAITAGTSTNTAEHISVGAGTTAKAQINLASSTAPTSPNDGDVWFDGSALKIRISGATKTVTVT